MTALAELGTLLQEVDRAGTSVMALVREGRPQEPWTLYPGEYGIFDRKTRTLEVLGAWGDTSRLDEALADLAQFLGATNRVLEPSK